MVFEFRSHEIKFRFAPVADALKRIRTTIGRERSDELNLNSLLSSDELLVFQSPTGSTQVKVAADRLDLLTQYFDDYMNVEAWGRREKYAMRKIGAALELLEAGGFSPLFFGTITTARSPARGQEPRERLKEWATKKLNFSTALTDGNIAHDFSVRASHVVDDKYFANVNLNWYREQTLQFQVVPNQVAPVGPINEWEVPVTEEGLEIRLDWNNKHAIYEGQKEWSLADVTAFASSYFTACPRHWQRATEGLEDRDG